MRCKISSQTNRETRANNCRRLITLEDKSEKRGRSIEQRLVENKVKETEVE